MTYHLMHAKMPISKNKKRLATPKAGEEWEQREPSHTAGGSKDGTTTLENCYKRKYTFTL